MKKTILLLGLASISQGHAAEFDKQSYPVNDYANNSKVMDNFTNNREYAADFDSEPQHHIVVHEGKDDLTLEQLAKKVYEKDDLSKIKGISSEDEIKLVRDLIYTWDGNPNQFLRTPVTLNQHQKEKILPIIKYLKRYNKDPKQFAKKITRYMKNLSNVERAYALMASGLNPEDLTTNFTEYSNFVDEMIGRKRYREQVYKFIRSWEKSQDKFR